MKLKIGMCRKYKFSHRPIHTRIVINSTCDRHETDNCCFLWYVKPVKKKFDLVFYSKLVHFDNNSHLPC